MTVQRKKQKHSQSNKNFVLKKIKPLNDRQLRTFEEFEREDQHLVLHGIAGTGKTFLALYLALREVIEYNTKQKVVIVRSAVPTREIGFLPGNAGEKTEIYELPYKQICSELFGRDDAYGILKTKGQIIFIPTSFVRGITITDSIIILDEVQNLCDEEINSIITRIGENSRIIICGDTRQCDLYENKKENFSGIHILLKIVQRMNEFSLVEFCVDDIVRNKMIATWIRERERMGL